MITDDDDKVIRGETTLAVDGQGIYFHFDRKNVTSVLNDVNITVTRGAIYSLLGPSGCGKTTLLKCIIGQHKPQQGSLKIYGKAPRSKGSFIPGRGVGYMPQDLALYPAMTIEETLTYFGALYHMDKQEINKRISCLIELLALPSKKEQIKHLSGGQQRRVSLAAALIHKPPLLILDEPTVGVDPLLRKNIWGHLVKLAKTERSSVVITTHYIEEARQAHMVGFMRHGHLLAERNPGDLIKQYGVVKLEDVFRRLCQNDHKRVLDHGTRSGAFPCIESPTPSCSTRNNTAVCLTKGASELHGNAMEATCSFEAAGNEGYEILNERNDGQGNTPASLSPSFLPQEADHVSSAFHESWTRFSCLCNKNFLWFKRNPCVMVFQIFVPTITLVVFCLCVGGYPFDLPVAIVNMEEEHTGYSGTFLNSIDKRTIQQKLFGNLSVALQSVRNGEYWAAVHIGPKFSTCLLDRFLDGIEATNDTLQCSEIKVYLDMTNHLIARTIYPNLLRSFQTFATDFLKKSRENFLLASHSLKVEDPVYASSSSEFTEFLAPGVILTTVYILSVVLTAMSIILEKKLGLLQRTFTAGATDTEVLLSLFFTFLLIVLLQITILLLCTFLIFDVPCNGSIFWTVVCVLLTGVGGMSYGLFISTICDDENLSFIIITATFTVTFMLSGIMWPLEAMPHYLRSFSNCLPLTLICHTLRCILSRGWKITDHRIWDGCLVSIAWIFSFLVLSIILLKIKK